MQYLNWGRIKVLFNKIRTSKGIKCFIMFNTPMVLEHLFDVFVVWLLHVIR